MTYYIQTNKQGQITSVSENRTSKEDKAIDLTKEQYQKLISNAEKAIYDKGLKFEPHREVKEEKKEEEPKKVSLETAKEDLSKAESIEEVKIIIGTIIDNI